MLSRNHPLAKCRRIRAKSLANESFIAYPSSRPISNSEEIVRKMCREAGFELNIAQRALQISTAISLVSAGIGVTIVPESASSSPQKGVIFRPLVETTVTEIQVAYRKADASPVLQNFLGSTHEVVTETQKLANTSTKFQPIRK